MVRFSNPAHGCLAVIPLATTVAELDQSDSIRPEHLNEAINYRTLDRQLWT